MSQNIYISPNQILKFDIENNTLAYFDFYKNHWEEYSFIERENNSDSSDLKYYQIEGIFPYNMTYIAFNPASEDKKNIFYLSNDEGEKTPTLPFIKECFPIHYQENIDVSLMHSRDFSSRVRLVKNIFFGFKDMIENLSQAVNLLKTGDFSFFQKEQNPPISELIDFAEQEANRLDHWYIWNGHKKAQKIRTVIEFSQLKPIHTRAEGIYNALASHRYTLFSGRKPTHSIERMRDIIPGIHDSLSK